MKTQRFLSLFLPFSFPSFTRKRTCLGSFASNRVPKDNLGTRAFFLVLPPLFVVGVAPAQDATNAPTAPAPHVVDVPQPTQPGAAAAAQNMPSDKVAEYQKRFQEGYALQQAGKLADARKIYDGILAEQPDAKRSLLEAGRISFQLGDFAKADTYLEKLHEIVPDFPEAIELLIQVNQALGRDVRVELLARDFTDLRNSGKIPQLQQSLCFVRERIPFHDDTIVVSQFFDYTTDPNTVWMGEVFDPAGKLQQRLLLNYDPDATKALRARDPKFAQAQVFTWFGHDIKDGKVTAINAYVQILALPDYNKFRSGMMVILEKPPKPIYSAPVPAAQ